MLGWLASADEAGLDEDGMVALFTSVLRDFFKRREGASRDAVPATDAGNGGRRMNVIETTGLGKRYGKAWALHDCTLTVPEGCLAALVGPNGSGKSTLMNMAVGLTLPTEGTATVLDGQATGSPVALDDIAFMAQDAPVYKNMSVADMLHLTRNLNRRFDGPFARARLDRPRHPAQEEVRQAVRRPAGAGRAHPGARQAAAAAHPRRAPVGA